MTIILSRIDKLNTDTYNWLKNKGLKNAYIIVIQIVLSNNILTSINAITSSDISVNSSARGLSKTSINSLKPVLK